MGFDARWVQLIMQCIRTVSYQIIHARREMGHIVPTRGLRQGDPLSPYLFIICAEGLSAMLNRFESLKMIKGVKVCKRAMAINHMLVLMIHTCITRLRRTMLTRCWRFCRSMNLLRDKWLINQNLLCFLVQTRVCT